MLDDMQPQLQISTMSAIDLPHVMSLQKLCYDESLQESLDCLASKVRLAPHSCLVAKDGKKLLAYVFAMPAQSDYLSPWNSVSVNLPEKPNCLYLHDLAIAPAARGKRLAQALLERLLQYCVHSSLTEICLVAVQESRGFWEAQGFAVISAHAGHIEALQSFGEQALLMRRFI